MSPRDPRVHAHLSDHLFGRLRLVPRPPPNRGIVLWIDGGIVLWIDGELRRISAGTCDARENLYPSVSGPLRHPRPPRAATERLTYPSGGRIRMVAWRVAS